MILIIAEKPQSAKKIAYALSDNVKEERYGKVKYYFIEIDGKKAFVVPAVGHLFVLSEKEKGFSYPVFDVEWKPVFEVVKGKDYTKQYLENFSRLSKYAREIVIATDYDPEGEVIAYNIIKHALKKSPGIALRMKFSSLTKRELVKAWEKKKLVNTNLAKAGLLRHYLDWYWGINFSRALMKATIKAGKRTILSIGRVQGVALKILADREREISDFKPIPYWVVHLKIYTDEGVFTCKCERKFETSGEAFELVKKINEDQRAVVTKVESLETTKQPPYPFDLGTLQREAYSAFGFFPKKTLSIAQRLYEMSLITYPRTDSQQYANVNHEEILKSLATIRDYSKKVEEILERENIIPTSGKKTDPAHPAIMPTGEVPQKLSEEEQKLFDLIVRRYLATLSLSAVILKKTIKLEAGGVKFSLHGNKILQHGWLEVYPYIKVDETQLPNLKEGDIVRAKSYYEKKFTSPPPRFTPASLIAKLESMKIGTKSTRGEIIETLYKRGYITGRSIKVTPLGMAVVEVLEQYVPDLLDENLTRKFEEDMELVAEGKVEMNSVLDSAVELIERISETFKEHETEIGQKLIEALNKTNAKSPKKTRQNKNSKKPTRQKRKIKNKGFSQQSRRLEASSKFSRTA